MFEHDREELALRRNAIYNRGLFMSEYTTYICGDIYAHIGAGLTGNIGTHLSQGLSLDNISGTTSLTIEQKMPSHFGVVQFIKSRTEVYLIHNLEESKKLQVMCVKKKSIDSTLEGTYVGVCYDVPKIYSDFVFSCNKESMDYIHKIINSSNKWLRKKRRAQFKLELNQDNNDNGGEDGLRKSPVPVPVMAQPVFV
jgi:hypothetical protein